MNEYIGVILAAGKGTRLYPITDMLPKPMILIGEKTLIEYQIEILKKTGIKEIIIVIGHFGFEITKLLGDGSKMGVRITYVEQKEPYGSAHALSVASRFINRPFFLLLGDIYFITKDLKEMMNLFEEKKANAVLGTKIEKDKNAIKKNFSIFLDENERVIKVVEKPKTVKNNLKGCGLYLFDENIFEAINRTPQTALRNEYEITESIQIFIEMGYKIYHSISILDDINVTFPYDLFRLNMEILDKLKKNEIIGENVAIGNNVKIKKSVIGNNVVIGDNCFLENVILLSNSSVSNENKIVNSIVTLNHKVKI